MIIQAKESVLSPPVQYFLVEVVEVSAEGTMRKRFFRYVCQPVVGLRCKDSYFFDNACHTHAKKTTNATKLPYEQVGGATEGPWQRHSVSKVITT